MISDRDSLDRLLGEVHALETETAGSLAALVEGMRSFPELQNRFELFRRETAEQCRRLEAALRRASSAVPEAPADRAAGRRLRSMSIDDIAGFAVDLHASMRRPLSLYRVLVTASEEAGDEALRRLCLERLWQADAMAAWLRVGLPSIAQDRLPDGERRRRHAPPGGGLPPRSFRPAR